MFTYDIGPHSISAKRCLCWSEASQDLYLVRANAHFFLRLPECCRLRRYVRLNEAQHALDVPPTGVREKMATDLIYSATWEATRHRAVSTTRSLHTETLHLTSPRRNASASCSRAPQAGYQGGHSHCRREPAPLRGSPQDHICRCSGRKCLPESA